MILSVSRRTDIPAFYSEWFFSRMRERYLYTRNPMNYYQVSKISLDPEVIDCIVFWSKNPEPLLKYSSQMREIPSVIQYTVNAYGKEVEPGVPSLAERIAVFKQLAGLIGTSGMVFRYDPILISPEYTMQWHIRQFEKISGELEGSTGKCVISFLDSYRSIQKAMEKLNAKSITEEMQQELAKALAGVAHRHGMVIESCAEKADLSGSGVTHGHCIDKRQIEKVVGCSLRVDKDKNQRAECGCAVSIDIGMYHCCIHGCRYCYANHSGVQAVKNYGQHRRDSPFLYGENLPEDKISERKMESQKERQMNLFSR